MRGNEEIGDTCLPTQHNVVDRQVVEMVEFRRKSHDMSQIGLSFKGVDPDGIFGIRRRPQWTCSRYWPRGHKRHRRDGDRRGRLR